MKRPKTSIWRSREQEGADASPIIPRTKQPNILGRLLLHRLLHKRKNPPFLAGFLSAKLLKYLAPRAGLPDAKGINRLEWQTSVSAHLDGKGLSEPLANQRTRPAAKR